MAERKNDVIRRDVWDSVLCSVKVNHDARELWNKQTREHYLECKRMVPGGVVFIYLYGYDQKENVIGKTIPVEATLKGKNTGANGNFIHYFRCDVAEMIGSERPDCVLYVGDDRNPNIQLVSYLPREVFMEDGRRFLVAFTPLKKKK